MGKTDGEVPGKTEAGDIDNLFGDDAAVEPGRSGQVTIRFNLAPAALGKELREEEVNPLLIGELEKCCFKKNPYLYRFRPSLSGLIGPLPEGEQREFAVLRTHKQNFVAVDQAVLSLLNYFDGQANVKSIFRAIPETGMRCRVYTFRKGDYTDYALAKKNEVFIGGRIEGMISLVKVLFGTNLVQLVDIHSREETIPVRFDTNVLYHKDRQTGALDRRPAGPPAFPRTTSPVLLLGDGIGQASTGILYIASFLRRNGIEAYCQWNDLNNSTRSLGKNVAALISKIKPRIVGVSLKWFPHIARVLEICKTVKTIDPGIKVVVGGNTASYFNDNLIRYECIDYVVKGDGEVPLLKICRDEREIPNCIYKRDGKIIETPITYVQDEQNSSEIYLSHLDQIFVSQKDPYLAPFFYICTGKGCDLGCFYCGGCKESQEKTFNRKRPFLRGVEQVRRDLEEVKNLTSTFWFDFDLPVSDTCEYYHRLWAPLDLIENFCEFYFWKLPADDFIDLLVKRFRYVYFNIDLCSLSEDHRLKLSCKGIVKPQPTDKELFSFFDHCEKYNNVEVIISHVNGLPFFSHDDIEKSKKALSQLLGRYSTIGGMEWARLHAQPGAPIIHTDKEYGMRCYARTFEDFLHFSKKNLQEIQYPEVEWLHYPYIYYLDEPLNSKISQFYFDIQQMVEDYLADKRQKLSLPGCGARHYYQF